MTTSFCDKYLIKKMVEYSGRLNSITKIQEEYLEEMEI